jgi:hypothetical protein
MYLSAKDYLDVIAKAVLRIAEALEKVAPALVSISKCDCKGREDKPDTPPAK